MKPLLTILLIITPLFGNCQIYRTTGSDWEPQIKQYQKSIDSLQKALVASKNNVLSLKTDSALKIVQINKLIIDTGLYKYQVRVYRKMSDTLIISNNNLRNQLKIWSNTNQLDSAQLAYFKTLPVEYVNSTYTVVSMTKTWPVNAWFKYRTTTYVRKPDGTTDELTVIDFSK